MNDEIKEILEYLNKNKEGLKDKTYYPEDLLGCKDLLLLLDYITNLQEENENLKNIISSVKEDFLNANNDLTNLQEENEKIRKMNMHEHKYGSDMEEKYLIEKSRIEKAVEYIEKEHEWIKNIGYKLLKTEDLLNILNGRSDE